MFDRTRALALAALLLGSAGCATTGTAQPASYSDSAQRLYEEGLDQLESGDYMQAIATFEQVRTRFPYSQYAALAELRGGDAEFAREKFKEAIDIYQNFVKLHPTHADADWAAFRIGEAHFESIPSGFFLFPPPSERDITEARAAQRSLEDFLAAWPKSEHAAKAKKLLGETLEILAKHELYVARFYASREKWQGAADRYEALLKTYPNVLDADATFGLVKAYEKLQKPDAAQAALRRFLERHPQGADAEKARDMLGKLGG